MAIPIELPDDYHNTNSSCQPLENLVFHQNVHQNCWNEQQHADSVLSEPVSNTRKTMDFAFQFVQEILAAFQPQLPSVCGSEPISVNVASGHIRFRKTRKRTSSKLIIKYTSETSPVFMEPVSGILPDVVTCHNVKHSYNPNNYAHMRSYQSESFSCRRQRIGHTFRRINYGVDLSKKAKCTKSQSTVTFPSCELSKSIVSKHHVAVGRSLRHIADQFEVQKVSRQEIKRTSSQLEFLRRYESIILKGMLLLFEIL